MSLLPITLDVSHSEMFPYAIRLAKERGSKRLFIEATIIGKSRHIPDILGIKENGEYVLVECEWSTGAKFEPTGAKQHLADDTTLREISEVHFIIRGPAKGMRKWLVSRFGQSAVHDFDSMKQDYGELTVVAPSYR